MICIKWLPVLKCADDVRPMDQGQLVHSAREEHVSKSSFTQILPSAHSDELAKMSPVSRMRFAIGTDVRKSPAESF